MECKFEVVCYLHGSFDHLQGFESLEEAKTYISQDKIRTGDICQYEIWAEGGKINTE